MSVSINVDVASALKKLGLDTDALDAKGIKIVPYVGGAKFVLDGEVVSTWPAAPAKIAEIAAKGFTSGNAQHETLKDNAKVAYDTAMGADVAVAASPSKPSASLEAAAASMSGAVPSMVPQFPIAKMKTAPLIPLVDADKLYQPVKGTSSGSRYYVVGVGNGINVAARIKNKQVSIRVEGKAFAAVTPKLIAAGIFGAEFGGSFQDNYASMHVEISTNIDAQKIIGAVLGSLYTHIGHGVPDVSVLEGKS